MKEWFSMIVYYEFYEVMFKNDDQPHSKELKEMSEAVKSSNHKPTLSTEQQQQK